MGPWLEILGFNIQGSAGFKEAFYTFWVFCEHGLRFQARARKLHKDRMRQLCNAMLRDLHRGFRPFWTKYPIDFEVLMCHSQLFTEEGKFYTLHRQLMLEVEKTDDLASLGYEPMPIAAPSEGIAGKRPARYRDTAAANQRCSSKR